MGKARARAVALALLAALSPVAGCSMGKEGLSGASTCDEFMHSDSQDQIAVTQALAGEYQKPDYATPLGAPAVPYFCANNPDVTLDEFFAGAG
jgi:hypothetical protein